jgi:hypothetical protein
LILYEGRCREFTLHGTRIDHPFGQVCWDLRILAVIHPSGVGGGVFPAPAINRRRSASCKVGQPRELLNVNNPPCRGATYHVFEIGAGSGDPRPALDGWAQADFNPGSCSIGRSDSSGPIIRRQMPPSSFAVLRPG